MTMHVLDVPGLYLAWQAPFVEQKLVPFRRRHPALPFRRVLDVGCGPGTNSAAFRHCDYLGVDLNPGYIASARKRYGARFEVADAARLSVAADERFDCVFVNSLLHHMRDDEVAALLDRAGRLLSPNGKMTYSTYCFRSLAALHSCLRGPTEAAMCARIRI